MRLSLAKIEPKTSFYQANGTGRDTYIADNSGGLVRPNYFCGFAGPGSSRSRSSHSGRTVRSEGKTVHYHSDGTGRDSYVVTDEGGFARTSRPTTSQNFFHNLRSYPAMRNNSMQATKDYFGWAQNSQIRSMREWAAEKEKTVTVKKLVDRLAQPKVKGSTIFKNTDFRINTSKSVAKLRTDL